MASVYDLKPRFQALLRPLCGRLARAGITANQVTIAAVLFSIALGLAIAVTGGAHWCLLLLPPVLFLRMALNAIDGMLAREFGQKSRLGAVLNELGDVISDTALYLPFALVPGFPPLLTALVVIIAVKAEMTGVIAVQVGAERRYDGPFGKSDRAVFFSILAIALGLGLEAGAWIQVLLLAAAAAGLLTIFNRARSALRQAS